MDLFKLKISVYKTICTTQSIFLKNKYDFLLNKHIKKLIIFKKIYIYSKNIHKQTNLIISYLSAGISPVSTKLLTLIVIIVPKKDTRNNKNK